MSGKKVVTAAVLALMAGGLLYFCGPANDTPQFPGYYKLLFVRSDKLYRINTEGVELEVAVAGKTGAYSSPSFYNQNKGNTFAFILKEGDSSFLYKSETELRNRIRVEGYPNIYTCRWQPGNPNQLAISAKNEAGIFKVLLISANNGTTMETMAHEFTKAPDLRWNNDGTMLFMMERNLAADSGGKSFVYRTSNGLSDVYYADQTCGVLAMTDLLHGALLLSSQSCDSQTVLLAQSFTMGQSPVALGYTRINGLAYREGSLYFSDGQNLISISGSQLDGFNTGARMETFEEMIPYPCQEVLAVSPDNEWVFYLTADGNFVRYKLNDDPNDRQSLEVVLGATGLNSNNADISVWAE